MDRALAEMSVEGPGLHTTIALHRAMLRDAEVCADRHDVQFLDRRLPELLALAASLASSPAPGLPITARGSLQLVQSPAGGDRPDPLTSPPPPKGPASCPTPRSLSPTS
jgi:acetyl-CoA carboxylase biotin carboxylase subunit